jgi:hypothetical protein
MQLHWRFCTVQNPLVCATPQEKAGSRNTHLDVLAQVEVTDKGNTWILSEKKVDMLSTKQKWQREEGQFKPIKYFGDVKEEKLTWTNILSDDVKGGGGEKNCISPSISTKPSAAGVAQDV